MGWSEFSTRATTNSEALKERARKAAFHYNGPHTWKHRNFKTKKIEETTEIVEFDFIDLAVLLGIRETCYKQEGDTPLNREEVYRFLKALNQHNIIRKFLYPVEEKRTQSLEELASYFNEWDERLVTGTVKDNEDGSVEIYLNAQTYMSLWRALTSLYPGTEIDVWEYEDFDDMSQWYKKDDRYLVKYGTRKKIDQFYDQGTSSWDDEEETEMSDETLETNSGKKPSIYEIGMQLAYAGEYEKSIKVLEVLKDNVDALNNIGVDYERLKNYEKAYEYYQKANTAWSLDNLVRLYNTGKIPMNVADYVRVCGRLNELGDFHGYVYLSKLYSKDHPAVPENGELALKYAKKAYEMSPNKIFVLFNYAWCLNAYSEAEEDLKMSHKLYESILTAKDNEDDDATTIAKHNYAWQCQEGCGCEQDISRAIYWYIRAYEEGHINSAWQLARIYQTYDGYINQELSDFWKRQYDEMVEEED